MILDRGCDNYFFQWWNFWFWSRTDKNMMAENMKKRKLTSPNAYILRDEAEEIVDHLLLACKFAKMIWQYLLKQQLLPVHPEIAEALWSNSLLWNDRNVKTFERAAKSTWRTMDEIIFLLQRRTRLDTRESWSPASTYYARASQVNKMKRWTL